MERRAVCHVASLLRSFGRIELFLDKIRLSAHENVTPRKTRDLILIVVNRE